MKTLSTYILIASAVVVSVFTATAETFEPLRYGDFEQWVTRDIHESAVIGGKHKTVYAVGPQAKLSGNNPYIPQGGTPWASSNVMAKVCGVVKTSNAVFPDTVAGGGRCARLSTILEECKAIGIINIKVLVAGSLFLGRMFEPITSTSDPYSKMEMGVKYTKCPDALCFDYKLYMPAGNTRIYSSGFGRKRTLQGHDNAEALILLQRRWEDADGNLYAHRVGTGREQFGTTTHGWQRRHLIPIHYGNITGQSYFKPNMGLLDEEHSYYARNSKGKMVPVREGGWDAAGTAPTHVIVRFSAASGEPYTGTLGLTMWVDNVAFYCK